MIVLKKRKIVFTVGTVLIILFASVLIGNKLDYKNISNKIFKNEVDVDTIQTVALPVNNKVIVIDARTPAFQMHGAESSNRNYRSRNKFKNCFKSTEFVGGVRRNCNTYKK